AAGGGGRRTKRCVLRLSLGGRVPGRSARRPGNADDTRAVLGVAPAWWRRGPAGRGVRPGGSLADLVRAPRRGARGGDRAPGSKLRGDLSALFVSGSPSCRGYCVRYRMTRQISPEWLRELEELADLGLPIPPTRFRGLKRVVVRLCWVFLHRQVEYNHEVAKSVERVVAEESEARATMVYELRGQIEQLKSDSAVRHDEMLGVV